MRSVKLLSVSLLFFFANVASAAMSTRILTAYANSVCVDIANGSVLSGAGVSLFSCSIVSGNFAVVPQNQGYYALMPRNSAGGMCLDYRGGLGSQLTQQSCPSGIGGPSQLWQIIGTSTGSYHLISADNKLAMEVQGGTLTANGTPVLAWANNGDPQAKFFLPGFVPAVAQIKTSYNLNYCVDIYQGVATVGAGATLFTCGGAEAANENFLFVPSGVSYVIKSQKNPTLCLDNSISSKVQQKPCSGAPTQLWTISGSTNGSFSILNYNKTMALSVQGGTISANFTALVMTSNVLAANTKFFLNPIVSQPTLLGMVSGLVPSGAIQSLSGWACVSGTSLQPNVNVYAGNPSAGGVLLGTYPANTSPSDASVNQTCGDKTATLHGFNIPIDFSKFGAYGGQPIYVMAVSPDGTAQTPMNQSGTFKVPAQFSNAGTFAQSIPLSRGLVAQAGDQVQIFKSLTGQNVTVTVQSPRCAVDNPNQVYQPSPLTSGLYADAYFANAITYAQQNHYCKVMFPKATYTFAGNAQSGVHLYVPYLTDMTIDGQGSTLNFTQIQAGVGFGVPTRVLFKNFTLQWPNVRLASLGTIIQDSNGQRLLQISNSYPMNTASSANISAIDAWDMNTNTESLVAQPGKDYPDQVYFNPTSWPANYMGNQIYSGPAFAYLPVGEIFAARHYNVDVNALFVNIGSDFTIENVTFTNIPGVDIYVRSTQGLRVAGCTAQRMAGALFSSTADIVHIGGGSGDIIVENNNFGYSGDDALNLHAYLAKISAASSTTQFNINNAFTPTINDSLAIFDSFLNLLSVAAVGGVTPNAGGYGVTVNSSVAGNLVNGFVADLNQTPARYVIQNNTYTNVPRGMLLQAPYGLVQNNKLSGVKMEYAMMIVDTQNFMEGPGAVDLQYINNQLLSGSSSSGRIPAVRVFTSLANGQPSPSPVHQNLLIQGNTLSDLNGQGLNISSAKNVVVQSNTLTNVNKSSPQNWGSIAVFYATNVIGTNNKASGATQGVVVDGGTTSGISLNLSR